LNNNSTISRRPNDNVLHKFNLFNHLLQGSYSRWNKTFKDFQGL